MGGMSASAVQGLRVRSALNPALWLSAITTPTCLLAARYFGDAPWVRVVLVLAALVPPLTAAAIFVYFAIRKPEKLQSEEYQLRHETLQLIQVRATIGNIDAQAIQAIAGSPLHQLPAGEDKPA
jgi:hypothetical protein